MGEPGAADTRALIDTVSSRYLPRTAIAAGLPGGEAAASVPLLAGRSQIDGRATAYVCQNHACQAPVADPEALARQIA